MAIENPPALSDFKPPLIIDNASSSRQLPPVTNKNTGKFAKTGLQSVQIFIW